ncbi:anthranilate phosphoribosyltransferase [Saxibacter everestensis]|uniref:Anthranilate phosphoribosyltransferase n=1 Tax=Saxibacter everestensis TaxID=2909229 RepID=A0ABY8QZ93_9MICO|nr:anthranilate phosphoribosyltransferase [Brevibacteriaceae bacterium ZFBP1038]
MSLSSSVPGTEPAAGELTWPKILRPLLAGQDLDSAHARWAMDQVMGGEASDAQIAGFLIALRAKGETVEELHGLVEAMLDHSVPLTGLEDSVDIVGTGGDGAKTVNISSTAAMIVAAAGYRVVKHGNRASSSASGSADVLEVLGVNLNLTAEQVGQLADLAGISFCFAQVFHPAMRFAAAARRELGVPTAFNLLGPLTNPARAKSSAIGVADLRMAPLIAGVLGRAGIDALVFRGEDGLDELTTTAPSDVWEVRAGEVSHSHFEPLDLGIPRATVADLRGAAATFNADVTRRVLDGEASPVRDIVRLNAAAAMVAARRDDLSSPLPERLARAYGEAGELIDSGKAARKLEELVAKSHSFR